MSLYSAWFGSTPAARLQSWQLLGLAVLLSPLILVVAVGLWWEGRR